MHARIATKMLLVYYIHTYTTYVSTYVAYYVRTMTYIMHIKNYTYIFSNVVQLSEVIMMPTRSHFQSM